MELEVELEVKTEVEVGGVQSLWCIRAMVLKAAGDPNDFINGRKCNFLPHAAISHQQLIHFALAVCL